jgi:hypothetical protein
MLRLEREGPVLLVDDALLSREGAVQEIAAVELDPGLGARDVHHPARLRIIHGRDRRERPAPAVEHVVVVVADGIAAHLLDVLPDPRRLAEVHRGPLDRPELARRDQRGVDRRVPVGVYLEDMVEDAAVLGAAQVEVAVVGHVDRRVLVGRDHVVDESSLESERA